MVDEDLAAFDGAVAETEIAAVGLAHRSSLQARRRRAPRPFRNVNAASPAGLPGKRTLVAAASSHYRRAPRLAPRSTGMEDFE